MSVISISLRIYNFLHGRKFGLEHIYDVKVV